MIIDLVNEVVVKGVELFMEEAEEEATKHLTKL
jgi:hypothetical protein